MESAKPELTELLMNQVPLRTMPTESACLFVQSPATGKSPGSPYRIDDVPYTEPLRFEKYQVALRKTAGVSMPSPFQSPITGMSPWLPYRKTISAFPEELL